jgi:TetR/AcrR family transcriptional regulator
MLRDAEPSAELLRASMGVYFRFLQANPELVRIMAWMFLERDADECVVKDREIIELGVARLRQAQEEGRLRSDLDPRFILFSMIGLAQHWFQDREHFKHDFGVEGLPDDELDEAYLADMSTIFFEGILPRT